MRPDDESRPGHSHIGLPWDRPVSRRDLLRYGSMLGFGALGATMLASCAPLADDAPSGATDLVSPPAAEAKYLAVVIVDGCRGDYLGTPYVGANQLPTLNDMLNNGTQYMDAWTGIMESITPACHASIGTGRFAKNNGGILGFYWENPTTNQYLECANLTNNLSLSLPGSQNAIDADSMSQILKQANTPTMASLLKNVDPTAKVYAGAGVKFYAADVVGGPDADFVSYYWNDGPDRYRPLSVPNHQTLPADILNDPALISHNYTTMNYAHPGEQDALVVDLAVQVLKRERPRIVILNLGEMDYPFGHINGGPRAPKYVGDIMRNADRAVGRLMDAYRELRIFEQTVFAFLGDHGMVPLAQQVDVGVDTKLGGLLASSPIYQAAVAAGTAIVDDGRAGDFHTGGFVWLTDPTKAMKVSTFIDDAKIQGVSAVYFRGQLDGRPQFLPSPATAAKVLPRTARAYSYLLETMNGPNAPHIVLLYPERTGTVGAGGGTQWYGDHGGASWGSHHMPLIISGPGIRQSYQSHFPARLVDLAPTFLRLLGVPFPALDGIVLADALNSPLRTEASSQRVMSSYLTPIASALKSQSFIDIANMKHPVNPPPGVNPQNSTKAPPPQRY